MPCRVSCGGFFLITYATGFTMFWIKYRCVAPTQDAVYVLSSTKRSGGSKPISLVGALPPPDAPQPGVRSMGRVGAFGERHWLHQRFHCESAAADSEGGFTDPQP